MPVHKMVTIDGIRVRLEDVDRYRARSAAPAGPLTRAHAEPSTAPPSGPFDPGAQGVNADDVLAHLATADEAETERVLDAEANGKGRKTLLEQREALLAQARERASGGGA